MDVADKSITEIMIFQIFVFKKYFFYKIHESKKSWLGCILISHQFKLVFCWKFFDSEINHHLTVRNVTDSEKCHLTVKNVIDSEKCTRVKTFTVSDISHCQMMIYFTVKKIWAKNEFKLVTHKDASKSWLFGLMNFVKKIRKIIVSAIGLI